MGHLLTFLFGFAIPIALALAVRSLPASYRLRRRILVLATVLANRVISCFPGFDPLSLPFTLGTVLGTALALRWLRSG